MDRINLDDDGVQVVNMTVPQARDLAGSNDLPDELSSAIDNAQGDVFTGVRQKTYVVIVIE